MDSFGQMMEQEMEPLYEQLARKALATYGLETAELRYLGPSRNVVFRVQNERGRWAIRICPPDRDHKALMRELLWLVALNLDTDLGVPEPVLTPSGDLFQKVSMRGLSGFRAFTLFRWVKGHVADELREDHLRAWGRFTGTMHQHAQTFDWPEEVVPDRRWLDTLEERIRVLQKAIRGLGEPLETVVQAFPVLHRVISTLGYGRDVIGAVHGDLGLHHVLFAEGTARAIDFETVHWNYYALDVATCLRAIRSHSQVDPLTRAYIDGYSSVRPLPCDPEEHLPAMDFLHAVLQLERVVSTPTSHPEDLRKDALQWAAAKARGLIEEG